MKTSFLALASAALLLGWGCSRSSAPATLQAKAYGAQIVEVSGGKQVAGVGSDLPQPVVVQVNSADGTALTGALVTFRGEGLHFNPAQALTDSSGQASTVASLGFAPGDYQIIAGTSKPGGAAMILTLREIALGYEQQLGSEINEKYCIRCHDAESTPERVSNFDNLSPQPHTFTDGNYLNNFSDADLIAIITHGGPALKKSPQTPAFEATLSPTEIKAVIAFMRAVADPPYSASVRKINGAQK